MASETISIENNDENNEVKSVKLRYTVEDLKSLQDSVLAKFRPAYFDSQFVNSDGLFDPIKWFDHNRNHFQRSASEPRRSNNRRPLSSSNYADAVTHNSRPNSRSYKNGTKPQQQQQPQQEDNNKFNKENTSSSTVVITDNNSILNEPSAGRQLLQLLQSNGKLSEKRVRIAEPIKDAETQEELENLSKYLKDAILGNHNPKKKSTRIHTVEEIEATMISSKSGNFPVKNDACGDRSAFFRLLGALRAEITASESGGVGNSKVFKNISPPLKQKSSASNNNHSTNIQRKNENRLSAGGAMMANNQQQHPEIHTTTNLQQDLIHREHNNPPDFNQQWSAPLISKQIGSTNNTTLDSSHNYRMQKAMRNAQSARSCISQFADQTESNLPNKTNFDPMNSFQNQINFMPQHQMAMAAAAAAAVGGGGGGGAPHYSLPNHHSPWASPAGVQMHDWFSLYCRLANMAAQAGLNQPVNHNIGGGASAAAANGYLLGVSPALVQRYMANQDNLATFLLRPDQLHAQMRCNDAHSVAAAAAARATVTQNASSIH